MQILFQTVSTSFIHSGYGYRWMDLEYLHHHQLFQPKTLHLGHFHGGYHHQLFLIICHILWNTSSNQKRLLSSPVEEQKEEISFPRVVLLGLGRDFLCTRCCHRQNLLLPVKIEESRLHYGPKQPRIQA